MNNFKFQNKLKFLVQISKYLHVCQYYLHPTQGCLCCDVKTVNKNNIKRERKNIVFLKGRNIIPKAVLVTSNGTI